MCSGGVLRLLIVSLQRRQPPPRQEEPPEADNGSGSGGPGFYDKAAQFSRCRARSREREATFEPRISAGKSMF